MRTGYSVAFIGHMLLVRMERALEMSPHYAYEATCKSARRRALLQVAS